MRNVIRAIGVVIGLSVLLAGAHLGALQATGNFHSVIPGTLYRSAQPTANEIARYHATHDVRTIVNLRGENQQAPWYRAEIAEAKRLGIAHVDFRMSARRELTQVEAAQLIAILERAEKPILIHCKAGADRSSLAAALYLAAVAKHGEAAAEAQISIRYGHVSLPFLSSYAMNRSFEALEERLGFPDS